MYLFEEDELFEELALEVAQHFRIQPDFVVKDYFVSLILKKLQAEIPEAVFKGGTSLSKGFQIIERFSEDIDIAYTNSSQVLATQGQRREVKRIIFEIIDG